MSAAAGAAFAEAVEALASARNGDPFAVLGPHRTAAGTVDVRAFVPDAAQVAVIDAAGDARTPLVRIHPAGVYAGAVEGLDAGAPYRLSATWRNGAAHDFDDPYRFPPLLGEQDRWMLAEGTHRRAWEVLGAHPTTVDGVDGTRFAVWAPGAMRVSVVGDFNAWDGRRHPMRVHPGCGVWELFLPAVGPGALYKFEILSGDGRLLPAKADPCGRAAEMRPAKASVVTDTAPFVWNDAAWTDRRGATIARDAPVSIYEVHPGSWQRAEDGGFLGWRTLAERLVPYAVEMGFTHIELMPISEHPFDGSWGYQPIGLYAPTARFGTPEDFKHFMEVCHAAGLGVILDWVPGHFPSDGHGLAQFDGTHLYEHADPRQGFHRDWNTLIYNFGRTEVAGHLIANALFWLDRFHLDGLRIDAVASMLYLDYSREEGEWIPNPRGGRENLDAIDLLQTVNSDAYGAHPGIVTMAEESTAFSGVSRPVHDGGLGFGYKWNMGWMHDTLQYMARDPIHRRWHHDEMTFGLIYAFSENFVLPLSHDEVVHGKGALVAKMPGADAEKFANLRAYFGFMWGHPGKKLLFMGGEFAQWGEWDESHSLDWWLLDDPDAPHAGMRRLVADLNRLYRSTPALHARDCDPAGFDWVIGDDRDRSIYAWLRWGADGTPPVLVVSNFTPILYDTVDVGVPFAGRWRECLNTDAATYGGGGMGNAGERHAHAPGAHGRPAALPVMLPPLSTVMFVFAEG